MDLYSGLPYWIAKNPLYDYVHPLKENIKVDVAIIGAGITGAFAAHELCSAGIRCAVFDKGSVGFGSSVASTALLQYEIDTPMHKLAEMLGDECAVGSYKACLKSIADIRDVLDSTGVNADFQKRGSVYFASSSKDADMLKREYAYRKKHGLPVEYLERDDLFRTYGIEAPCALANNKSAQMDAYMGACSLIKHHMRKSGMDVFTHTEIVGNTCDDRGCVLVTRGGLRISCDFVVIAAGFEAGRFLPEKVMKLTSTYAIASSPVQESRFWHGQDLVWETREPYLYIRTNGKNRIIAGGEDEDFRDPDKRDSLLREKTGILQRKIQHIFPGLDFKVDMAWSGTFSSTEDGLPFIGPWPGRPRTLYALGYGGNGITFSMIASQIIAKKVQGKSDKREKFFSFERKTIK